MSASIRRTVPIAVLTIVTLCAGMFHCTGENKSRETIQGEARFRRIIIDQAGPSEPWGKSVGDVNGDGFEDVIVGGYGGNRGSLADRVFARLGIRKKRESYGELVWYRNPSWEKNVVSRDYRFSTDHEVADIDRDGLSDIVSVTNSALVWFNNPAWKPFIIDQRALHDIEVADLDGDGDFDVVARNQSGFGYGDGDYIHFYRQDSPLQWDHFALEAAHGEGLRIADLNRDGRIDVIVNRYWFENPGNPDETTTWKRREYSQTWKWAHVFVDTGDINQDGRMDIVLAPSESAGNRYRISWFEAPRIDDREWEEHVIDQDVETVHHFVSARDMDLDGRIDIVTAEMHQGENPDEIAVYYNRDRGSTWEKKTIATSGSHSMRTVDFDRDGDWDLIGANWSGRHQTVELWENLTLPRIETGWRRHLVDDAKPWRSVFVIAADLDQDGNKDILSGAWWYQNPGNPGGRWERRILGNQANNVFIVKDLDLDSNPDIVALRWNDEGDLRFSERILRKLHLQAYPSQEPGGFVWGRSNGRGLFEILTNITAGEGDFLQGAAIIADKGKSQIALSWHEHGHGIQLLTIPDDPVRQTWTWHRISDISQDEQLSSGDIDRDGDADLMLGTRWLRNEGDGTWTPFVLHTGNENPDRNRLADINADGKLDVVIGYEAISMSGKVAWYEPGPDTVSLWKEHPVGIATGPMSLDVGDLDRDADLDIVVGEHDLENPDSARLLIFENIDGKGNQWRKSAIHVGDEHHDGAQTVDIDNDGDLDVISIGWGHGRLLLYENANPLPAKARRFP